MKKVYETDDIKKLIADKEGCSIDDIKVDYEYYQVTAQLPMKKDET